MPVDSGPERSVTIITGGSRGIGAAIAKRLAADAGTGSAETNLHLIINYAGNRAAADDVVANVSSSDGSVTASAVQADVGKPDDVAVLFAAADEAGMLTGLVNNAAILYPIGPFTDITAERLERMWAVNITGSFLCAREAVVRMSTANGGIGGAIVNVSSLAASFGSPNEFVDYAASKGALDTMTKGLSTEVAAQGIRVNAVRPGLIETDIHAAAGQPDRVQALAANVPLRRGGKPEEVANLVAWLLSAQASYVTGALMDIGGGR